MHLHTVMGSHGELVLDEAGNVIPDESFYDGDEYRDIKRFNIDEYRTWEASIGSTELDDETDILLIGYWSTDGTYTEPEADYRNECKIT